MMRMNAGLAICLGTLLLTGAALAPAQTQPVRPRPAPSANPGNAQFELEFWKSTERIDTPAAYSAYLEAFPKGMFATLARAAISKGQAPGPQVSAPAAPATAQGRLAAPLPAGSGSQARLAPYSAEARTGSIELSAGSKLIGPATLWVGGMGAKKQLLVPKGEWVVLAAADHDKIATIMPLFHGASPNQRVRFSTIALARFDGERAISFVVFEYNRVTTSTLVYKWPDAARCDAADTASLYYQKEGDFTLERCAQVRRVTDSSLRESAVPALWPDVDRSLRGLGGTLGEFNIESSVVISNQKDYLRISRFDCTRPAPDGRGCQSLLDEPRQAAMKAPQVEARVAWTRAYLPLAVTGFKRDLDDEAVVLKDSEANKTLPE